MDGGLFDEKEGYFVAGGGKMAGCEGASNEICSFTWKEIEVLKAYCFGRNTICTCLSVLLVASIFKIKRHRCHARFSGNALIIFYHQIALAKTSYIWRGVNLHLIPKMY